MTVTSTPSVSTLSTQDYVFDWARMSDSRGDTGPYLQYAYARLLRFGSALRTDGPSHGAHLAAV